MYCPVCGRELNNPTPRGAAFPMYFCDFDGIVFDRKRNEWHGFTEAPAALWCPGCGHTMDGEPRQAPVMSFCYQCGITFDRNKKAWYGVAMVKEEER